MLLYFYLFIWVLTSPSTHCIGRNTMGSWKGRGNQYIQLVKVLCCKLPTNGKQLPAFPLEVRQGTEPLSQRWEARVLPFCDCGPLISMLYTDSRHIIQKNRNPQSYNQRHSRGQRHGKRLEKRKNPWWICFCKEMRFSTSF